MASPAQITANQHNAQLSTGPKTEEGKAAVGANAKKHGLAAAFTVLAHEDQDEFNAIHNQLREEHQPTDLHQNFLVNQMMKAQWQLARAERLETVALELLALPAPDSNHPGIRIVNNILAAGRDPLSMWKQFQPRLGIVWDPTGKGKTLVRLGGGIYYARTPGLDFASTRSTNGSVGQSIYRDSTFNGFGLTPPAYTELIPNASNLAPDHPQVYVTDKNFTNPRTYTWTLAIEQALTSSLKLSTAFTYAKGVHNARFVDRNDAVFGSPWSTGLGADHTNGIGQLTTLESSSKSLFRGLTIAMQKQLSHHFQFQMNYMLSEDLADDDNERDPFSYRYAVANNFKPDYGFSDRMERHRFNAFGLWEAPWGIEFSPLISFHTPQPISPLNRVLANGYIIKRNSLWKDNTFFALDFRAAKTFRLSERFRLQAIVDAFNVTNRANPKHPETTSLLFNFDGTVQSGLGDPRQAQLGLRLLF